MDKDDILLTTNGMFIIDDIIKNNGDRYTNIPGGGGTYAAIGAVIVSPSQEVKRRIKWIVDQGFDFPDELTAQIKGFGTGVTFRKDSSRRTTRGLNEYRLNDLRDFKYVTEKRQISVSDWIELFGQTNLQAAKCIHLVSSGDRTLSILKELPNDANNLIIWEPLPSDCIHENLDRYISILNRDELIFISPNAEEGARLFNVREPKYIDECKILIKKFGGILKPSSICILRCGKLGSLVLTEQIDNRRDIIHYPAYHCNTSDRVIDPTGGGNSFLGGFAIGYVLTNDIHIASICGNVAAGCIIEELGIPKYDINSDKWNGLTFYERLEIYIKSFNLSQDASVVYRKIYEQ
ncbi:hypothetical protein Kpol_1030p14 [Vanderwaltozyma polyspora DSM 70294]|uniref:Carbohydrate kinase PfkB domain-containing protein n=1 Tax=Vanderwaltozyma polyspora (strain ATCC 22028 / DSM 70294 / BCRC 21397 / CBS 2163 / NBRC 10782 / NRRL Y-8283 / UCD 57-17) TaxID=436907 RepID=A7TMT4_VANPO|nr:uncharacterized protein Kpol_1030p14 [Vanderwaltozyma polyspora DSM 70294]EDO16406.1 hypothetical protein Kpol_1030p14 [Vanderwaltozyma polyspora DSM 70294]